MPKFRYKNALIQFYGSTRELFIHGKAMVPYVQLSTNCRIGFQYNENKICTLINLTSPQLVDNCLYGTIAFPCIKSSLVFIKLTFLMQNF